MGAPLFRLGSMIKGVNAPNTLQEDFRIKFMKKKQEKISQKSGKTHINSLKSNFPCKSLTNLTEPSKKIPLWTWSTPQLHRKTNSKDRLHDRRKSSEWTKLRNSLEFISRSREALSVSKSVDDSEKEPTIKNYSSLTFLGQLYDVPFESEKKGFEEIFK